MPCNYLNSTILLACHLVQRPAGFDYKKITVRAEMSGSDFHGYLSGIPNIYCQVFPRGQVGPADKGRLRGHRQLVVPLPEGTTARVQREMQTALSCSSAMRTSQTCVRRPTCIGVAVAVTTPSRLPRK